MPSIDWDSITNIYRRQSPQRKRHIRYGSAAAGGLLLGFGIGALCGGLIGALAGALIVSVGGLVYVVYRSTRTPTTPAAAKAPHTARMNKAPRSSISRAATPVATPVRQSSESRLQALDELRKQIVDPLAADIETLKQSIAAAKQANKEEKEEEQKEKVSEEEEQKEELPEPIPVPVSDVTSATTATVPRPLDLLPTTNNNNNNSLMNSPPNSPPVLVEAPLHESVEECGIDRDGYCCFGAFPTGSVNVSTRPQANPRNCAASLVAAVADVCSDRASTSRGNSSIVNVDTDTDTKLPGVVVAATEEEEEDEDEAAQVSMERNLKDKEIEDEPEDFVVLDEDDEEYVFLD